MPQTALTFGLGVDVNRERQHAVPQLLDGRQPVAARELRLEVRLHLGLGLVPSRGLVLCRTRGEKEHAQG